MLFTNSTYIGIDPTAGTKPITYAAFDQEKNLIALAQGAMEEVLAFTGGQQSAFVAVNAPSSPNKGFMKDEAIREKLSPSPRPGRWLNLRLVEYELRQHGIGVTNTPGRIKDCPKWMQSGFKFYRLLEEMGYKPYPTDNGSHQWLEVYPHAVFTALLEVVPFQKHSLEGRLQRQLVLYEKGLSIDDPMDFFEEITRYRILNGMLPYERIYTPEEIDAICAAYTAYTVANNPDEVTLLGKVEEGQIVIPVPTLKMRY